MAIQFTDFSRAPVQESPIKNLLENAFKGYQIGRAPKKMDQEDEQRALANKLKSIEVEQKPAQLDLERRYKEALIKKANTLANMGGKPSNASGDFNNFMIAHPEATSEDKQKWFDKHDKLKSDSTKSVADRRKQIMNSEFFNKQPAAYKSQQLALAAGLGMDPGDAGKAFENEGKTVSDLAKERGVDPKTIVPVYPLANENVKQTQIRSSQVAELLSFEKQLNNIQGKYSRKFLGYSPKQVVDALKNENPDEQGMILAARNLAPEVSALRAKIATNGSIGIEALKELTDKSLGNLKIFEPLVSPEARDAMNKYTDKLITEANNAYTSKMQSNSQIQPQAGQITPPTQLMANALNNNSSSNIISAPEIPSWIKNASDFKQWKNTLTPQQVEALRVAHIGD